MINASQWWESFFEGIAVDMWLKAMPASHTAMEADSVATAIGTTGGGEILDVPCGAGRLALPLAERGYAVTAVDWSEEFLAHARALDSAKRVSWQRLDMRGLPWRSRFDGAFCAGNSFGYMDDEGNRRFLESVAMALKPGARFVLDTPMVLENLLGHIQDRAWWLAGDIHLLVSNRYVAATSRLETDYTFVRSGHVETRHGSHRAYSYRELAALLEGAGFAVETRDPWTRQAHSVMFVATRM